MTLNQEQQDQQQPAVSTLRELTSEELARVTGALQVNGTEDVNA